MPILVRPVREQLEHDRIIRLLEAKWRRKFKVDANPGDERNVGVKVPVGTLFPDLILTEEGGVPYLDKFAVLDEAQGEGLGRAVWQLMRDAQPRLFWRSRLGNPINSFYDGEADGSVRQTTWRAYWYGLGDLDGSGNDLIRTCLEHCRQRPATLEG